MKLCRRWGTRGCGQDELFGYRLHNLLVDFIDGEVALNEDYAVGVAGGDLAVFLPDAAVEGVLLLLKAVFVFAGLGFVAGVAVAGAGERGIERGQEQEGQVGLEVAADEAVQIENDLRAELPAAALEASVESVKRSQRTILPASRAG